jgi:hypothetical protein
LEDPCALGVDIELTDFLFEDQTYNYRDDAIQTRYRVNFMATAMTLNRCGNLAIEFKQILTDDAGDETIVALNTELFDDGLNGNPASATNEYTDFTILPQDEESLTAGDYKIFYRIYLKKYTENYIESEPFNVFIRDPCALPELENRPSWCLNTSGDIIFSEVP